VTVTNALAYSLKVEMEEKFYLIVPWAVMDAKVLDADKQTDWSNLIIDIFVWLQIYAHIDIPIFIQW